MELQDLKDIYKSKTAEKRYDYYRTFPLDEKDLFNNTLLNPWENFLMIRLARIKRVSNERQSRRHAAGDQNERRSQQPHF